MAELLDLWQDLNVDRWAANSSRNQAGRARLIAQGPLGHGLVDRLKVEEIDRWVLGLRAQGVGPAGSQPAAGEARRARLSVARAKAAT